MKSRSANGGKRKAAKVAKTATPAIRHYSKKTLQKKLAAQKLQAKISWQKQRALAAVKSFRVRKADRGNFIQVTTKGKRGASLKGRKGYLVYVTKDGKKRLATHTKDFKPQKISDIEAPLHNPKFRRGAAQAFESAKLQRTARGKAVVKGRGSADITGVNDFSDKTVEKIAKSLKKTIEGQASKRSFLIRANVLVVLPGGNERVYSFVVPIQKADHISIEVGGLKNFVRQKFYAFMARELAFDGYVTSGSANHIRRLGDNEGLDKEDWTQDDGEMWRGNESEVVKIKQIEWEIEQAK